MSQTGCQLISYEGYRMSWSWGISLPKFEFKNPPLLSHHVFLFAAEMFDRPEAGLIMRQPHILSYNQIYNYVVLMD